MRSDAYRDAYERGYEEARETYEAYMRTVEGARIWNAQVAVLMMLYVEWKAADDKAWELADI